tara:strand:- start:439 stop:627 length:189 start_codon:yes stop_codon:yes gene_type:complete
MSFVRSDLLNMCVIINSNGKKIQYDLKPKKYEMTPLASCVYPIKPNIDMIIIKITNILEYMD